METVKKRRRLIRRQQLEDVPELIQQIQSLLPADEAARTCVVSKSWLHALSTNPALRFQPVKSLNKQEETKYRRLINRTLRRYQRENIPIVACNLHFGIHKQKSASRAENWIKHVTSKTCLKELCLAIVLDIASFTLPDEIFSSENLNTLSIKLDESKDDSLLMMSNGKLEHALRMKTKLFRKKKFYISSNPVIACVNLRVLELSDVHISEEVLHNLLSTSKLLEKINLKFPKGLKKIKVNNLRYLQELKIAPRRHDDILEIHDLPSLRLFLYQATQMILMSVSVLSNMYSIGNLRELNLDGVRMDDGFSNVINTNFPLLESLTLNITSCWTEIIDIRCLMLRRLKIQRMEEYRRQVQVNAPRLLVFRYECVTLPTFLFPTIAPEKIELSLALLRPIDHMFILQMRETLDLSSKFSIEIKSNIPTFIVPFNIDDVRTRFRFPATNVEKLLFVRYSRKNLRYKSLLIDVLFSICRPDQVEVSRILAQNVASYLLAMEKKTRNVHWPQVEIRDPEDGKWETLSTSSISLLDEWFHFLFAVGVGSLSSSSFYSYFCYVGNNDEDVRFQFMNTVRVNGRPLNLKYSHSVFGKQTKLDGVLMLDDNNKASANYSFESGNCEVKYSYVHGGLMTYEPWYDFGDKSWDLAVSRRISDDSVVWGSYRSCARVLGLDLTKSSFANGSFKVSASVNLAEEKKIPKITAESIWDFEM